MPATPASPEARLIHLLWGPPRFQVRTFTLPELVARSGLAPEQVQALMPGIIARIGYGEIEQTPDSIRYVSYDGTDLAFQ